MDVLTREQAIKRIKDIMKEKECDHFGERVNDFTLTCSSRKLGMMGAVRELMAIFDIKEEELL